MSPDRPNFSKTSKERTDNQDQYSIYRFKPLLDRILQADWEARGENRQKIKDTQREKILGPVFGEVEIPRRVSPSVACYCLRWVGYEALGYKPAPPTARSYLITSMGSAIHWEFLKKLQQYLPR
ncbi:MAG: hypothetical protein Q8Q24_00040, partial [bacterium]|nr:hypothetical protein [bacterium]